MASKKRAFIKETPRLIEKVYNHNGIKVGVRIDFVNKQISLIEFDQQAKDAYRGRVKKWIFAKREVEYLQSWQQILTAMGYAISEAEKELKDFIEEEEKDLLKFSIELQEEVDKKQQG